MPPFYKSNCEVRPIHHLLALTMNCNDDSKPIYSVQYNPVHLKGKQTIIYFRTPETVYLLQTSYTNHNYPFYSPPNPDFSISKIGIYLFVSIQYLFITHPSTSIFFSKTPPLEMIVLSLAIFLSSQVINIFCIPFSFAF